MSFALFGALSVVVSLLGVVLRLGLVPPNRFVGFRTANTLRDRRLWYAVNFRAGGDLCVLGALLVLPLAFARLALVPESLVVPLDALALNVGFIVLLMRGTGLIARYSR